MSGDCRIDQLPAMRLEGLKRAKLIGTHQSAITDDVCCQNRGKFALNMVLSCSQLDAFVLNDNYSRRDVFAAISELDQSRRLCRL